MSQQRILCDFQWLQFAEQIPRFGLQLLRELFDCDRGGVLMLAPQDPHGVGSQLSKTFSWFATPDCPCHEYAVEYDGWGPDGCIERMETIIDRFEEQAAIRKLPFNRWIMERLVRVAINKARRGKPL
jgi:hypothetical protein